MDDYSHYFSNRHLHHSIFASPINLIGLSRDILLICGGRIQYRNGTSKKCTQKKRKKETAQKSGKRIER